MSKFTLFKIILFSLILFVGCAKRGNPTGGEGDITPPLFLKVTPETQSVSVSQTEKIKLEFNEWVQPTSAEKAVTVHPIVPGGFKIKTKSRTLTITPNDSFVDNTTYHISINTELKDYYNNRLEEPVSLVFSTGAEVDSGTITGSIVLENDYSDTPLKVSLFLESRFDTTLDTTLFTEPDYFTQCDSVGYFSFENINENSYRIIGFRDDNGDNFLTPKEMVFIPEQQVVVTNTNSDLLLTRVSSDTILNTVSSPLFLSPHLMTVGITPPSLKSIPDSIALVSTDSVESVTITSKEFTLLSDSSTLIVHFADSVQSDQYDMITSQPNRISAGPLLPERDTTDETDTLPPYQVVVSDTVRFNAITTPDTTIPTLVNWKIQEKETRVPEIVLNWSIPVRIEGDIIEAVTSNDTNGLNFPLAATTDFSKQVIIKTVDTLEQNQSLELMIHLNKFVSLTGVQADSLDTLITFTTPQDRDIAISLLLSYPNSEDYGHWKWELLSLDQQRTVPLTATEDGFLAEEVPAGLYTVTLFDDINGNSLQDKGTLFPYQIGESRIFLTDTVKAKGHWRTEMILDSEVHLLRQSTPLQEITDSVGTDMLTDSILTDTLDTL